MVTAKAKEKILLQICCASCGAHVSQVLSLGYDVVLYFINPNIFPESEYRKREKEVDMIAEKYGLPLIKDIYDHADWLEIVKDHQAEPEKGQRCYLCYRYRMKKTADKAKDLGIANFSTTLSVSPYKVFAYIREIGKGLEAETGVRFLDQDFKKQNGSLEASLLSKSLGLYRQDYCGCEFSFRKKK